MKTIFALIAVAVAAPAFAQVQAGSMKAACIRATEDTHLAAMRLVGATRNLENEHTRFKNALELQTLTGQNAGERNHRAVVSGLEKALEIRKKESEAAEATRAHICAAVTN